MIVFSSPGRFSEQQEATVPTILVVDDEPDIRMILTTFLEAVGYRVVAAADGFEALARAREEAPDAVILDVMMPEMTGYQVARVLKAEPATAAAPILMLTAKTQRSDRFRGLGSGAWAYLAKPFELPEVRAALEAALAGEPAGSVG